MAPLLFTVLPVRITLAVLAASLSSLRSSSIGPHISVVDDEQALLQLCSISIQCLDHFVILSFSGLKLNDTETCRRLT
jgi:hypothetical protein